MRSYILKYLNEKVEAITEVISETGKFRITPTAQLNFRAKNSSRFRRYPVTKQGRNKKPAIPAPRQERKRRAKSRGPLSSRDRTVAATKSARKVEPRRRRGAMPSLLHSYFLLPPKCCDTDEEERRGMGGHLRSVPRHRFGACRPASNNVSSVMTLLRPTRHLGGGSMCLK